MAVRRIVGCIGGIIGLVGVLVLLAILFIYSGSYNVSAIHPDSAPVAWVFDTTMTHSVQRRAAGIKVPDLADPAMVKLGFSHYRSMCVVCHGAPGAPVGDIGLGLRPAPPELAEAAGDWKPNELFWITKNGIRMTGMPAWGPTHSDEEIWAIVAFLHKLPSLTPAQYRTLIHQVPPAMP
jgi:mono/diheme cytochrome c family protein